MTGFTLWLCFHYTTSICLWDLALWSVHSSTNCPHSLPPTHPGRIPSQKGGGIFLSLLPDSYLRGKKEKIYKAVCWRSSHSGLSSIKSALSTEKKIHKQVSWAQDVIRDWLYSMWKDAHEDGDSAPQSHRDRYKRVACFTELETWKDFANNLPSKLRHQGLKLLYLSPWVKGYKCKGRKTWKGWKCRTSGPSLSSRQLPGRQRLVAKALEAWMERACPKNSARAGRRWHVSEVESLGGD